ncbi:hypothetical protein A6B43_03240 [Vespertiliibacter pulmonis]|uniref:Putative membrane protein DUF2157 n=1 Tax=Vespertiliibacter pulmonis TaxID=1443036 RepID=A0A3N4VI60_9PAST|nr:GDYXXLXY domain-containing protein [Vespertiliibacter pulmonis]QLB20613.1 hypothetical protein A6B43_03240 [Vespertiliibacter pulmonis]RPE82746.1 putative membrane protein DUF2157 [Vespertiliibacter pulmonis]
MKNLADITWNQFLIRLFTLLGGGLLSSGIIIGIASNWLYLTKFEKLYAMQILLVAVIGLTIWLYRREITERLSLKTVIAEFLVAVIIGGLFILLEQVYQTGADIWQLFALWAILQLPLLIVLPNVVNILLWLVTFNLALIYSLPDTKLVNYLFQLFAANFILLLMVEFLLLRRIDPYRVIPRLLLLWLAVLAVFALFLGDLNSRIITLLLIGMVLLVLAFWLYKREKQIEQAVRLAPKLAKKRVPITLVTMLFCTLGIANFMIIQNEDILENGTSIILKLESKDPNSGAMQRNYLDLNYVLLDQVNEQLPNSGLAKSRVYILLKEDNGIMNLCRIEKQPPTDFSGCAENIYLPIYIDEYWKLSLPSQQYFFPEEKAQYYRQAKYAEYRFKKGKVLLARLLDEHLMPL